MLGSSLFHPRRRLAGRPIIVWLASLAIGSLGLLAFLGVHPWQGRISLASFGAGSPAAAHLRSPEEPCQSPFFGDIDGDVAVAGPDALWILRKIAKLPLPEGGDG